MTITSNPKNQKVFRKKLRNNMTALEIRLWSKLKGNQIGFKFRRQHGLGNYIVDFYCSEKKIVIELDGDSHYVDEAAQIHDQTRQHYLESLGIKVVRFTNKQVMENIDGVIKEIFDIINT